jgi:hypothetical protein
LLEPSAHALGVDESLLGRFFRCIRPFYSTVNRSGLDYILIGLTHFLLKSANKGGLGG